MNSNSPPILITVHRAVKYRDIVWNLRGNGNGGEWQGAGKREEGEAID
jgi:hypothetical protein